MPDTIAIMFTFTTYGTWLRGDERGWTDEGRLMPPNPRLERVDERRMKHDLFTFPHDRLLDIGQMIGESLIARKNVGIFALTVQTWHVHFVIAATRHPVPQIAKCAKDAVRWGLRVKRPIWTDHYDKRFCFDDASVRNRIDYVERHNLERGWPRKPWPFLKSFGPLE
jgi:REP element-mobilizing transposase RayT